MKAKTAMQCTNCQRVIAEGETVTSPSEDELNRGNVLCSNCAPVGKGSKADAEADPESKPKSKAK
jgi:hypothetical protein